jgi:purine-binding chemotaxis protein CheW
MTNALVVAESRMPTTDHTHLVQQEFVTMRLGKQLFGISVLAVQDVMRKQPIAPIPLAPRTIAGSLNVRGRIVTALDMRKLMGLEEYPSPEKIMKVVVEYQHELYALIVDAVGDVLSLPMKNFDKVPANLDSSWRALAAGVFKLDAELLIILDVGNIIDHIAH